MNKSTVVSFSHLFDPLLSTSSKCIFRVMRSYKYRGTPQACTHTYIYMNRGLDNMSIENYVFNSDRTDHE